MGGSSYDRDVYSGSSYDSWGTSSVSNVKLSRTTLDSSSKPNNKTIKSMTKNPVVIVLDVTGSNINFAKLVYDKMPMFYGQLENYLDDFDIAVLAIGDAGMGDEYPLQVGNFVKGIELDAEMEKMVLESGGGGNKRESYELAAHYLNECCEFNKDAEPIVFFIGDEMAYDKVKVSECKSLGLPSGESHDPFPKLIDKVDSNVFMMLNKYSGSEFNDTITEHWQRRLPSEHTILINEEKSIVDLMLGVVGLLNKKRLKTIESDMLARGQTLQRLSNVRDSLLSLSESTDIMVMDEVKSDGLVKVKRMTPPTTGTRI